jgi:hypothetical protein
MKLRLQADADLNQRIVAGLKRLEPAIDFESAEEAKLRGKPDLEVLAHCAEEQRVLVTHDKKTMPQHFGTFLSQRASPGVMIIPQRMPIGEAMREVYRVWATMEAEEWTNSIRWLPL